RHGGTVEKFIGDAVMAVFGAPVAHEDDPERAVRAAIAIRDSIGEELQIRTAVNTGEALVALDARAVEGEGMVSGDGVNTSAQLVTLVGVPGIGKSRLVAELFQITESDPDLISWRQGRSLPYGERVSFWALGEIVKAHAGILESDDTATAEEKLAAMVEALS